MGPLTEETFIMRTLDILVQYKESKSSAQAEYYDITLLFNCLLGLLIMPRQKISYSTVDRELPDILKNTLVSAKEKTGKSFDIKFVEYVIGLRNAVSHLSINESSPFNVNGQQTISHIQLSGETEPKINGKKEKHYIEYQFRVDNENQLYDAVNEILRFIYPNVKNSSSKG